jgi:hypothetical protein
MKAYYNKKAKKSKKVKQEFDAPIDTEVRDLLLNEYFYKVCAMYYRLKMIRYSHVRKVVRNKIAKLVADGEIDSQNSDEETGMYPVVLSRKATYEI